MCASIAIIQVQEIVKIADCEMGIKLLPLGRGGGGCTFQQTRDRSKKIVILFNGHTRYTYYIGGIIYWLALHCCLRNIFVLWVAVVLHKLGPYHRVGGHKEGWSPPQGRYLIEMKPKTWLCPARWAGWCEEFYNYKGINM